MVLVGFDGLNSVNEWILFSLFNIFKIDFALVWKISFQRNNNYLYKLQCNNNWLISIIFYSRAKSCLTSLVQRFSEENIKTRLK